MSRTRLPSRRPGHRFVIGSGPNAVHVSTGEFPDGRLGEIFLDTAKEGSWARGVLNAFAMSVSIGLQYGVPLEAFRHTFREFRDPEVIRCLFQTLDEIYSPVVPPFPREPTLETQQ